MTSISVIIPTLNRAVVLAESLTAVSVAASAKNELELIVVDNGSSDNTAAVCQAFAHSHPGLRFRYIQEPMPGLLSGRHRGAAEAKGDVLAYLDDDALVAPSWLDSLEDAFRDEDTVLVGGPSEARYEVEPPQWLETFWWEREEGRSCGALSLTDLGADIRRVDPTLVWGLNFAIRKRTLLTCGGFHPDCLPSSLQRFQGDGETGLSLKIAAAEMKAVYHPGAKVTHVIPASRLTVPAFQARGFYQGVCDSFSQIRRTGAAGEAAGPLWMDPLRLMKARLKETYLTAKGSGAAVRQLHDRAHFAGLRFHQQQVNNDPELLRWVLRPDYLDYALPSGWQSYSQHPKNPRAKVSLAR